MAQCTYCFGSGKVTCRSCSGRKYHYRLTGSGDMDMTPCFTCGGSGRMRCNRCGGTGRIEDYVPDVTDVQSDDPLAGRWICSDGRWLVFVPQGDHYSVEYGTSSVKGGSGTATLHGSEVSLQLRILFLINYSNTLTLEGNTLRGTLKLGPIPIPLVFRRN